VTSEFGTGYATCLRQFSNHAERLTEMIQHAEHQRHTRTDMDPFIAEIYSEQRTIEMWANASSDHLYGLKKPRKGVPALEWNAAKELQARTIDIGHGFHDKYTNLTEARSWITIATQLLEMLANRGHPITTLEGCIITDAALGLRADKGTWNCAEDLKKG